MMIIFSIIIPLIGTTLGAMLVLLLKRNVNNRWIMFLEGLAAGVMLAASIWSLIIPALELSKNNMYIPTIIGFILGMNLLLIFESIYKKNKDIDMLNLAVVIHNIPEGLSVGVAIAAALNGNIVLLSEALVLSIGIGIQNIPEGSIISLNLINKKGKTKAFISGFLSGVVEPIATVIAMVLMYYINPLMPYFLSFAAGAMIYVVVSDLVPSCNGFFGNVGICIGFIIMMLLDVVLS